MLLLLLTMVLLIRTLRHRGVVGNR
jgi:hypothetical protein